MLKYICGFIFAIGLGFILAGFFLSSQTVGSAYGLIDFILGVIIVAISVLMFGIGWLFTKK